MPGAERVSFWGRDGRRSGRIVDEADAQRDKDAGGGMGESVSRWKWRAEVMRRGLADVQGLAAAVAVEGAHPVRLQHGDGAAWRSRLPTTTTPICSL